MPAYEQNQSLYNQLQNANQVGFDDRGSFLGQNPDGTWGRPKDMAKQMGWGAYRNLREGTLARNIAHKNYLQWGRNAAAMVDAMPHDPNMPLNVREQQDRGSRMEAYTGAAERAIGQAGDLQLEGIRGVAEGKARLFGMRDEFSQDKDAADREAYLKSIQQKTSIWQKLAKIGQIGLQVGGAIGLPGFGGALGGLLGGALGGAAGGGGGTSSLWGALSGGAPKVGNSTTP